MPGIAYRVKGLLHLAKRLAEDLDLAFRRGQGAEVNLVHALQLNTFLAATSVGDSAAHGLNNDRFAAAAGFGQQVGS